MINQLFNEPPAEELVYRVCHVFGLSGMQDRRWFSKGDMQTNGTINKLTDNILLDDLKKIYIRCKARSYLTDIDDKLALTIFRQLLKTQGYKVLTRTLQQHGQRITQYRLNKA
jgi:hypothetical protein